MIDFLGKSDKSIFIAINVTIIFVSIVVAQKKCS